MINVRILKVETTEQLEHVRNLFREYAEQTGNSTCFQDFADEVARLPGEYSAPDGLLLLGEIAGHPAGCVALRRSRAEIFEMKRLYVRPDLRGRKLGRQLAEAALANARQVGYRIVRLDTLTSMTAARELYRSLGFRAIPTYYPNPRENVVCLELKLS